MLTKSEKIAFFNIVNECTVSGHNSCGIGTYKEKSLHFVLKNFFEHDPDYQEVYCCGYVADAARDGFITEIQTSSLSGMRDKLAAYAGCVDIQNIRIVFPIASKRRIIWVDPVNGNVSRGHAARSQKVYSFLAELIYISDFLKCKKLTLTTVEVALDEYRCLNGWSRDRKKGAEKLDRVPTDILAVTDYTQPIDLTSLVPETLSDKFTREAFSKATALTGRRLWAAIKVLENTGAIVRVPSDGRIHLYEKI